MFVLSEIDGHNEDRELARAATPDLLLSNFCWWNVRYWRVQLDGEDIATVDLGSIDRGYMIYGTDPYSNEIMHVGGGGGSMVQVVREHLQRFYDLKLYARDDFPGLRVIPA